MCKTTENIQLCSCSENLDLSENAEESTYIWILERVVGMDSTGLIGMAILPKNKIGELTSGCILKELRVRNIFDFDYEPKDNDSLRIERIDRQQQIAIKREYLFGEFLNFNYFKGEWRIGRNSPFTYESEVYKDGIVKLKKLENHKII